MRAEPEELRRHAAHLDDAAGGLDAARLTGNDTGMTTDAYGHLCVIVPILVETFRTPLLGAIGAASRSVASSADAIRRAADEYETTDRVAAASLSSHDAAPVR